MPQTPRTLLVTAAVLVRADGTVLIAQRPQNKPHAGLWEFPGGKVERDESPEAALVRELREEIGITALEEDLEPFTFVSEECDAFHLLMPIYLLPHWEGEPTGREEQELLWVKPSVLNDYAMPKPDLPLIPKLQAYFSSPENASHKNEK